MTHMAEDHGLSNGDNPIEVAQGNKLVLLPLTVNEELQKNQLNQENNTTQHIRCFFVVYMFRSVVNKFLNDYSGSS